MERVRAMITTYDLQIKKGILPSRERITVWDWNKKE